MNSIIMGSNPIYLFFRFAMARLDNKIAHRPKYSFNNNSHTSELRLICVIIVETIEIINKSNTLHELN